MTIKKFKLKKKVSVNSVGENKYVAWIQSEDRLTKEKCEMTYFTRHESAFII